MAEMAVTTARTQKAPFIDDPSAPPGGTANQPALATVRRKSLLWTLPMHEVPSGFSEWTYVRAESTSADLRRRHASVGKIRFNEIGGAGLVPEPRPAANGNGGRISGQISGRADSGRVYVFAGRFVRAVNRRV